MQLREVWDLADWTDIYYQKHFEWAGHIARIRQYDQGRLTHRVNVWKNYKFLDGQEQVYGKGRQNHGRCFKVWRWERLIQKYWGRGVDWRDIAQDRSVWNDNIVEHVVWRRKHA